MADSASECIDRFMQAAKECQLAIDQGELSDEDLIEVLDIIHVARIGIEDEMLRRA